MSRLITFLRKNARRLAVLRAVQYRVWRGTGISGISMLFPELRQLSKVVRRSAERDRHPAPPSGPRILFFTFRGWNTHVMSDALIAQALRQRGADVMFFTCGGRLPICDMSARNTAPPMPCSTCAPYVVDVLSPLNLPHRDMRDFITSAERIAIEREVAALTPDQFRSFHFDGMAVGEIVRPSLQWFLLSGTLSDDPETEAMYRRFLISGAILTRVTARMLDEIQPAKLYLLNGIFFAEHITIEHARRRGIPFITTEVGFMPDTQVFAHNGFAPYYDVSAVWPEFAKRPLTESEDEMLTAYLAERSQGGRDVGRYYPSIESRAEAVAAQLGIDRAKPLAVLFTNVDWDTACFAAGTGFESMAEWIVATIRDFAQHPEWQLVIRIHPGEVRLPFLEPRERVEEMLRRSIPSLPPNVTIVPPESGISSYALMDLASLGLVYTSTTGMEMALRGKPVIMAGRAYYWGKGFSFDAASVADYLDLLQKARAGALQVTDDQLTLARRYAAMFFFRHHLPFPLTTSRDGTLRLTFDTLAALQPGKEPALDRICDAILHDRPFFYDGPL